MKIGYARVSTEEQHLDMQFSALKTYGCDLIFSDQGVSGARFDRPGLTDAMNAAVDGSSLIVWRLDRLGRSLGHLVDFITALNGRGIRLVSLTENIDTRSSSGRFIFHMIAALAEFERSVISERTRAGMVSARERGSRIGRPCLLTSSQCDEARAMLKEHTESYVARQFNVHCRTLKRYLKEDASKRVAVDERKSGSSDDGQDVQDTD